MRDKCREHGLQCTKAGGGDAAHEDLPKWQPVKARRIGGLTGPLELKIVLQALRAIARNENGLEYQTDASRPLEPRALPVVDGPIIPPWHDKEVPIGRHIAGVNHAAEQSPVAVLARTGIAPMAGNAKAPAARR